MWLFLPHLWQHHTKQTPKSPCLCRCSKTVLQAGSLGSEMERQGRKRWEAMKDRCDSRATWQLTAEQQNTDQKLKTDKRAQKYQDKTSGGQGWRVEGVHQFRVHTLVLPEYQSAIPSTYIRQVTATRNSSSKGSDVSGVYGPALTCI